jgi:hypothetical protein
MNDRQIIELLNRLLAIHTTSFPTYLVCTGPWTRRGDEAASLALSQIVADQQATADRVVQMITDLGGSVASSSYPMLFTDLHDLALEFLLQRLIDYQQHDITSIDACVAELANEPLARALAEESLGAAKGHLESLEELTKQPSS